MVLTLKLFFSNWYQVVFQFVSIHIITLLACFSCVVINHQKRGDCKENGLMPCFRHVVLAIDDTHNIWTNICVKMIIIKFIGPRDEKTKDPQRNQVKEIKTEIL